VLYVPISRVGAGCPVGDVSLSSFFGQLDDELAHRLGDLLEWAAPVAIYSNASPRPSMGTRPIARRTTSPLTVWRVPGTENSPYACMNCTGIIVFVLPSGTKTSRSR
jgi:hypothetical protein